MKAIMILEELKKLDGNMIWFDDFGNGIPKQTVLDAIEELEEYESDMDSYLDYTTNSRCSKSFNADLSVIKEVFDDVIRLRDKKENRDD